MCNRRPHRRAAETSANPAIGPRQGRADVRRAVNDNRPFEGVVVKTRLQTFHAQGITVLPDIAGLGAVQTQAGGIAGILIGELVGHVLATVATVGDQFMEQQFALFKVENPKTLYGRGQGIIDHCESLRRGRALGSAALGGANGQGNDFGVGIGGRFDQGSFKRIGVGCR